MECFLPSRSKTNPLSSRCLIRSRRLTDMLNLDGDLLEKAASEWNLLTLLPIGKNHFSQRILKRTAAIVQVLSFGDHFWPLNQLAHVTRGDLCVFGRVRVQHSNAPESGPSQ